MGVRRVARAILLLATPFVMAGACGGDRAFVSMYHVTNGSSQDVVVRLSGYSSYAPRTFAIPASAETWIYLSGFDRWRGRLDILDEGCEVLFQTNIDAANGSIALAPSGAATWSDQMADPPLYDEARIAKASDKCR